MVGLVHIAFVLHPGSKVSTTHNMTGWILTKYAPLPGIRSLNFWMCALTVWYPVVFSTSVSLYWNCHLTDECHMVSRHAGVTDVSSAEPFSGLYSHGVPVMMYGDEKGRASMVRDVCCARLVSVEKKEEGIRRVPSASSGPTG